MAPVFMKHRALWDSSTSSTCCLSQCEDFSYPYRRGLRTHIARATTWRASGQNPDGMEWNYMYMRRTTAVRLVEAAGHDRSTVAGRHERR